MICRRRTIIRANPQIRIIIMDEIMQDILTLAKKKMAESGEYGLEAYREFVEESIAYYLEKGRLTDEDDLDAIQSELMEMYEEIKNEEAEEFGLGDEEEEVEEGEEKANEPEDLEKEEQI